MARVVLTTTPDPLAYAIDSDRFLVGRGPGNHLVLADPDVEPLHAEFLRSAGAYRVKAPGKGAIRVNGVAVNEVALAHGDVIAIGENELVFEDRESVSGARKAARPLPARAEAPRAAERRDPRPASPDAGNGLNYELEHIFSLDELKAVKVVDYNEFIAPARPNNFVVIHQASRAIHSARSALEAADHSLGPVFEATDARRGVVFLSKDGELEAALVRRVGGEARPDIGVARKLVGRAIGSRSAIVCSDACYIGGEGEARGGDAGEAPGSGVGGVPEEGAAGEILSSLCVPLEGEDGIIGAIYLDNPGRRDVFKEEDLDLVSSVADLLALAFDNDSMHERLQRNLLFQSTLERFHSPDVARNILEESGADGFRNLMREREVTVLFVDICRSTNLIERISPQETADLLNEFFDEMVAIIFKYKGTVDKFIGDAVMANFGAPISYGNDAELAVFAAIEMMRSMEDFKKARPERLRFDIKIGINTGYVIAGYVGSRRRLDYTVLGDTVNVASRVQDLAEPGHILVGETTHDMVSGVFNFEDIGVHTLKGKKKRTRIYRALF